MKIVQVILEFIVTLMRGWLSEVSRDNANKETGAKTAQEAGNAAALERAKDAAEVRTDIRTLSDDDLDDRMRDNAERIRARGNAEKDKPASNK